MTTKLFWIEQLLTGGRWRRLADTETYDQSRIEHDYTNTQLLLLRSQDIPGVGAIAYRLCSTLVTVEYGNDATRTQAGAAHERNSAAPTCTAAAAARDAADASYANGPAAGVPQAQDRAE